MFEKFRLPIFMDGTDHKCHFKHVCLALTRDAMMNKGFNDIKDMEEDDTMKAEWEENYETLRSRPLVEGTDTHKYWGSLFIA